MLADTSKSEIDEIGLPAPYKRTDRAGLSFLDLLITLARGKKIIIGSGIVCAILAIVISLWLPEKYTATVVLLPPQQGPSMATALAAQLGNMGGMAALAGSSFGLKNPNDMYVAMLKSQTVEDAMVKKYGLMQEFHTKYLSDARKAFEREATVDGSGKDGLIRVSIEARNPDRAAELANGYVEQFRNLSEHMAVTEASQRRLFFEQQLEQTKDKLGDAEEKLKETELKTGMILPSGQASALIQSAASLRAQITALEVQIQALRLYATDENAQLTTAQKELESLHAQLAKLGGSASSDDDSELLIPKGRVSEAALEYLRAERNVKYYDTIFQILARQFEAAKLDEAKEGAIIQVLDPATPPDRRSSPKRALIVIVATFVGLFIGFFFALLREALRQMQHDPESSQQLSLLRQALAFSKLRTGNV